MNKDEPTTPKPDEGTTGDMSVVGETSASTLISIQTLQGIYQELTGKSEEVGKSYTKPIRVRFNDLDQLNHKISQACEQYNLVCGSFSATIFYLDDKRDQFSSFDRFALHNAGSSSPVESVLLKYHFLVVLPKARKPQPYTVSIRIASRVAIERRMSRDFYGAPPRILRIMGNRTAVIDIEYIDYMVARNLLSLIDEWFQGLPSAAEFHIFKWLQAKSHLIPVVARFLTTVFAIGIVIFLMPKFIVSGSNDLLLFGTVFASSCLGIYVARNLAGWFADLIEHSLDRWSELSYLQLTKGDEQEIAKAERENRWQVAKGVGGFILTICVSFAAKIVANWLAN